MSEQNLLFVILSEAKYPKSKRKCAKFFGYFGFLWKPQYDRLQKANIKASASKSKHDTKKHFYIFHSHSGLVASLFGVTLSNE